MRGRLPEGYFLPSVFPRPAMTITSTGQPAPWRS